MLYYNEYNHGLAMDPSSLKKFVLPLLIACLIPVVYRTGKTFVFTYDDSLIEEVAKIEKRLGILEKAGRELAQQTKDVERGLHKLEQKIEKLEELFENEQREHTSILDKMHADKEGNSFEAISNGTGGFALIAISAIQVILAGVVLVLFVKVNNLKALLEARQSPPGNTAGQNCRKAEKT